MTPFTETQHYSYLSDAIVISAVIAFIVILYRYGSWDAVFKDATRRRGSLEGTVLTRMNRKLLFLIFAGPFLLLFVYFITERLDTRIDESGIHYQLFPAQWSERSIPWNQVNNAMVKNYIVYTRARAPFIYSISDKYGLYIYLRDGTKLIIGTRKPTELSNAIEQYFR